MNSTISIVVPVYNAEKYLRRCIDSILGQSYSDIEVILVNDGSIDNSLSICNMYAAIDSRIKVVDKPNGGSISARIAGINRATGDFIGFVDSDDYIHTDMYKTLYESLMINSSDMAICNVLQVKNNNKTLQDHNHKNNVLEKDSLEKLKRELLPNKNNNGNILKFYMWNKLFKKNILDQSLIALDENVSVLDDMTIVFPYIIQTQRISFVETPYYYYVQNDMSLLHDTKYVKTLDSVYRASEVVKKQCQLLKVPYEYEYDFIIMNAVKHMICIEKNYKATKEKWQCINKFLREKSVNNCINRFKFLEKIKMQLFASKSYGLLYMLLKLKR